MKQEDRLVKMIEISKDDFDAYPKDRQGLPIYYCIDDECVHFAPKLDGTKIDLYFSVSID